MRRTYNITLIFFLLFPFEIFSQVPVTIVRPKEIDDVLINPGMGFMTFQRFNGDDINKGVGWTEGKPIEYQEFDGNLENIDYPMTSIAYFRVYWKYMEPEMGKYNWQMIDYALKTAHERKQSLMIRIAPYGSGKGPADDVPTWYRALVGEKEDWIRSGDGVGWRVDAEDPRYARYFGGLIAALGKRYDGHPDLESVDVSMVGYWGEGSGSAILTRKTREALITAYTDNFRETPLVMMLVQDDEKMNRFGLSQADVGWRVDCIGDLGFWGNGWNHMYDFYPQMIIRSGMKDAWKKAPVSLEVCGTIMSWKGKKDSCQYCQGYTEQELKYIINETLKWHISSFNNKSSGIPKAWKPIIDDWLKKMGYRFVLRRFSYPSLIRSGEKLSFESWWDNRGVAPCYKKFLLAIRIKNEGGSEVFITDADVNSWLPGDNIFDDAVFIPNDMRSGKYQLQIGIVDRQSHEPRVNLAIEGRDNEGWYSIGQIEIKGR